jgi:hypothetical protein
VTSNGCNFCGKVGSQQISNDRNSFNYSCLEVKKKDEKKENQGKKKKPNVHILINYRHFLNLKDQLGFLN